VPIDAAVMVAPGAPLEVWQIDDPGIRRGGVLLETVASEVCGTDVHLFHGRLADVPYPIIPGHVVRALKLLAKHWRKLSFARVIGGRYGLTEVGRALSDVENQRVTKAVIVPRKPSGR
jgi:Zn-dependent alcohol dehydrogenase